MPSFEILIIEDEKHIARFLELELLHEGYGVTIAPDGRSGLKYVEETTPHLVLLDVMIPELNGMEVCRRIRQFSKVPIIMLTAMGETTNKVMGLDIGANDYMTKPFDIEELLARIRVALRNQIPNNFSENTLAYSDVIMNLSKRQVFRKNTLIDLTKTEYDLLEYLLLNQGIVLTRVKILENVWGYDHTGDTNLVDVYIRYLRSKLDDPYPVRLIQTVRGVGYMLLEGSHDR
jgi:DNA-binding response OmpR family regulator